MTIPLQLLIVEDRESDAELMLDELRSAGFDPIWNRVVSEEEYLAHLTPDLDLILADYNLPQFDGLRALELRNERGFDIPFILVSGSLGEERAVNAMRAGAADYLIKDRLTRLGHAVTQALEGKRLREGKKRADEEVLKSQYRFRALIEHATDAIALIGPDGNLVYISPSGEGLMGYPAAEVIGRNPSEFTHPDDIELLLGWLADLFKTPGKSVNVHYRIRHKDGSWRWLETVITNLLTEPHVSAVVLNYRDITARIRAEKQIQYQANLIESVSDAIISTDADSVIQSWNRAAESIYGWQAAQAVGKSSSILQTEQTPVEQGKLENTLREGGAWQGEIVQKRQDGTTVHILSSVSVILDDKKTLIGRVAVNRDISAQKQAEAALVASEIKFRALIEHATDAVALLGADSKLKYISPSTGRVLGFSAEEMLGRDPNGLIHPADQPLLLSTLSDLFKNPGKSVLLQYRIMHKDGTWRWIESTITNLIADPDVNAIVFNYRDITERRQAEHEVQRRADEFAVLYEMANDLAKETDLTSLLQTVVRRAMTLLASPGGSLLFYDKSKRDLEIVVSDGLDLLKVGVHVKLGDGIAGRVAETRQPMIVNDYAVWADRLTALGTQALTACIEVPMLYQGDLLGVLAVIETDPEHKFDDADINLLSLFASQAAGAVHNGRLLAQTQERANQLAALYDAGLALNSVLEPRAQIEFLFKIAIRALHADRAEFFRYEPARNELHFQVGIGHSPETLARLTGLVLPADDEGDIAGWVSKYRVPLSVPDLPADERWHGNGDGGLGAGIWVAVERENNLLGVLGVLSERVNAFTAMDQRLMVLFANQAAVALQNALLFGETRQRLSELQLVNHISGALRADQTLDEMLPRVLKETMAVLDAVVGSVWLADAAGTELTMTAQQGWGNQQFETVKAGQSMVGQVFATGLPYISLDAKTDPCLRDAPRGLIPEGSSGAGVPIRVNQQVIGVLGVAFKQPRKPSETDVSLLATVAEIMGNAIHRLRLGQQTEQQVAHLGALRAIDVAISGSVDLRVILNVLLEQVVTQLHIDASAVLLLNQHLHTLVYAAGRGFRTKGIERSSVPLGGGLAGRAALEGHTVAVADLSSFPLELGRAQLIAGEEFIAYYGVPLITKGRVTGVLEIFHRTPLDQPTEWIVFMEALAGQAAIAIDNATLFQGMERSNLELSLAYDATIEGWSHALDLRDRETNGHSERVTEGTLRLAHTLQFSNEELVQIRRGALLHDIGKMGIPDNILLKPGPLTDEEWKIMRMHPVYAYELLSGIAYLHRALDIPYAHHEKWDGTGYPRGLKGDQIPLAARIFTIVDVWDALCSDRPYRKGWSPDKVRDYIQAQSGIQFEPKIVDAFLSLEQMP